MFTRFNGNVVPFADDSTSTNRTVFGGTTQSDLIDDNLNTNFKKGWEIVGLNDNPTREDFNAMGYTLGALTAYLYEMGISEWNASQNYRANSRVTGSDGKIYKSLTGTTGIPNVGNNPTSDAVNWELEFKNFVTLTGNETIAGVKTFSSNPLSTASQSTNANALTKYSAVVKNTGDETIAGVKTFSSSPIVPTPTTDFQTATKKYVDSNITPPYNPTPTIATGTATFTATTNNINLAGIGIGVEIGDVIRIDTGAYNKLHTVESITNNDSIIVNYEHAGNRGNGSLKLPNFTGQATVTRIAKWFNAPIGLGQVWVDVTGMRTDGSIYLNSTGKAIQIFSTTVGSLSGGLSISADGSSWVVFSQDTANAETPTTASIPANYYYKLSKIRAAAKWVELR